MPSSNAAIAYGSQSRGKRATNKDSLALTSVCISPRG
jgi:hypothetical protein